MTLAEAVAYNRSLSPGETPINIPKHLWSLAASEWDRQERDFLSNGDETHWSNQTYKDQNGNTIPVEMMPDYFTDRAYDFTYNELAKNNQDSADQFMNAIKQGYENIKNKEKAMEFSRLASRAGLTPIDDAMDSITDETPEQIAAIKNEILRRRRKIPKQVSDNEPHGGYKMTDLTPNVKWPR